MTPSTETERPAARAREIDAGSYRVIVAAGLRHQFGRAITEAAPAHHYAIVSDDAVAELQKAIPGIDIKR